MSAELGFRFVVRHAGTYRQDLDGFEASASDAWEAGDEAHEAFCSQLSTMVSDEQNFKIALDHLRRYGGRAPGPDGQRLVDIDRIEAWTLARELRDRLRQGSYARGPLRRCRVPKRLGSSERRTIWVQNLEDRVVARGAAQILVPLLDRAIDDRVCSWRRRGTQHALAYAACQTLRENRFFWITEDLRNAFDEVPRSRLGDIVRHCIPNDEFCDFIRDQSSAPTRRGILQGSPLSPALLDLYLSHVLHRRWRRGNDRPPLFSYVDDLWIGCRPDENTAAIYEQLVSAIQSAGMHAKLGAARAITDIRTSSVTWLGYRVQLKNEELRIRSAFFTPGSAVRRQQNHEHLVAKFAKLHERPLDQRDPNVVIRGIIGYLAPTLPFEDPHRIYNSIVAAAFEGGFGEIWSFDEMRQHWGALHDRWLCRLGDAMDSTR